MCSAFIFIFLTGVHAVYSFVQWPKAVGALSWHSILTAILWSALVRKRPRRLRIADSSLQIGH